MDKLHNLPLSRPRKPGKAFGQLFKRFFLLKNLDSTQNKILGPPFSISLPKDHIEIHPKIFVFFISSPNLSWLTDIFVRYSRKIIGPDVDFLTTPVHLDHTLTIRYSLYISYVILNSQSFPESQNIIYHL